MKTQGLDQDKILLILLILFITKKKPTKLNFQPIFSNEHSNKEWGNFESTFLLYIIFDLT